MGGRVEKRRSEWIDGRLKEERMNGWVGGLNENKLMG